jgi:serine/threonine protein phosphatase PrpC
MAATVEHAGTYQSSRFMGVSPESDWAQAVRTPGNDGRTVAMYVDCHLEEIDRVRLPDGMAAVIARRNPTKSTPNEDAAAILCCGPKGTVLIVADGVGGNPDGDEAARIAVESLASELSAVNDDEAPLRSAILNGFDLANRRILESNSGAATTLIVAEISGRTCRFYHVGDSAGLVVGQRGKLKWQTVCHSPVGFALEAGVLDDEQAMNHEYRHLVSNVVGTEEMRIEIGPALRLAARDTVFIASDGVFDNLRVDEIVDVIRKGRVEKALAELTAQVDRRMSEKATNQPHKPDDVTAVAFRPSRSR